MRRVGWMLIVAGLVTGCAFDGVETGTDQDEITSGDVDGDAHPAVVMVLMDVAGEPSFLCSGTLIAPRVVLTAGHCTGEPGEFSGMRVFYDSDLRSGPLYGHPHVEASSWQTHPAYTSAAFFLHDVGVIRLSKAIRIPSDRYGTLPAQDSLDALDPTRTTRFTAVGYGVQWINAAQIEFELLRMVSHPQLVQINTGFTGPGSLVLSNNTNTGGTCFGDSGGPNFVGDSLVVGGVTSFGLNGSCGGTGGVFRADRADVLAFIRDAGGL
jgi:secreted trypsin-like serine protease